MKRLVIALASLLILSAVWAGADASPAASDCSSAAADRTKTPGPKATKDEATKTPRKKKPTKTPKPEKLNFSGDILSVEEGTMTLKTKAGEEVSFLITEDTIIKIPTLGREATVKDIQVGVHALVRALQGDDGTLTAIQVSVSPGKPLPKHHIGAVTAYAEGESVTIEARDGNEYTFLITEDTKILPSERADELAVGRRVTIISRRDVTGGPFTAQGIVVHPETEDDETDGTPTVTSTPTETPTATPTGAHMPELIPSESPTPTSP
jgi:hypothetical protein